MPSISELARCESEARAEVAVCCGVRPCNHAKVQSAAPQADPASPFSRALAHALAGETIPRHLIEALRNEGGDFVALVNAIARHRRG